MIQHISIILTGFSVVAMLVLLAAYGLFLPEMRKSPLSKLACAILLLSLIFLQIGHYLYFTQQTPLLDIPLYGALLVTIPAAFFFFTRVVLFPHVSYRAHDLVHLLPILFSPLLPQAYLPVYAFIVGTGYTLWFVIQVIRLRGQHTRFHFELFFFGIFAIMALMALGLGLALPFIPHHYYYVLYANSVSGAVLLIVAALIFFPHLLGDLHDITELAYAKSKLQGIDTDVKVQQLERLMRHEKQYENENLSLPIMAEMMSLTPHQLSELINTHYGHGFSRFVREYRVRAAQKLLLDELQTSVLTISLMTGFKTQSNFYTAFKEIVGTSPGQYRKRLTAKPNDEPST
ncbi:AraC family transcriptional regulator [Arenicella xantha]|uniref:AraC-like DNA-binding protein n=1 Tax=Arenicella xantha TaxID=644221 RepID=A0A395JR69_9GAMM|nr:helix-turn-helix domain-containing protein [Arenicella xantha]RBP52822.1 AraC-like DNA-binding protein [Arenicella xantha]